MIACNTQRVGDHFEKLILYYIQISILLNHFVSSWVKYKCS